MFQFFGKTLDLPEKPALTIPDPLSITRGTISSSSSYMSSKKLAHRAELEIFHDQRSLNFCKLNRKKTTFQHQKNVSVPLNEK